MKSRRLFLVILLMVLSSATCVFARRILWHPKDRPPVSLSEAHEIALSALKDRHIEYYCVHASLARTFSEGDWELHFASSSGAQTVVSVGSDKKARVSDDGFDY